MTPVEEPEVNGKVVALNGTAVPAVAPDPAAATTPIPGLEDVTWRPSYDREGIERYLAEVETEKGRLLEEIRLAEERTAAAQERSQAHAAEREARLGALLLDARAELDRIDAEHREIVAAIRAAAEDEAASIRERAQAGADAVQGVVASLTEIAADADERHVG